jgi:hypothetical protein
MSYFMVSIFSDSIETHGSPSLVRVSLGIRFMIRIGRLNMVSAGGRVLPDTSASKPISWTRQQTTVNRCHMFFVGMEHQASIRFEKVSKS